MNHQKTYRLTKAITSHVDPSVLHGEQGDIITIISESHLPVLIVEGSRGRFTVHSDYVSDINVGNMPEIEVQAPFMVQKAPGKKATKTTSLRKPDLITSTLF